MMWLLFGGATEVSQREAMNLSTGTPNKIGWRLVLVIHFSQHEERRPVLTWMHPKHLSR